MSLAGVVFRMAARTEYRYQLHIRGVVRQVREVEPRVRTLALLTRITKQRNEFSAQSSMRGAVEVADLSTNRHL